MATSDTARLAAFEEPIDAVDAADVLKRLQDSALGLLAGLDRAPRSLRIKVGQVEIELDWPVADQQVVQTGVVVPAAATAPAPASGQYLTAHMVGVFYRCPERGAKPFVDVDDEIVPGQQVGIIEAMKLMMPVESDVAGRVVEVLVADGAPVEYGDRLYAVEPAGG